jgi:peroxiredoxin
MAQAHPPLRLGDGAPPFALRTDEGQEVRLADVVSSGPAIVVFIRGTW